MTVSTSNKDRGNTTPESTSGQKLVSCIKLSRRENYRRANETRQDEQDKCVSHLLVQMSAPSISREFAKHILWLRGNTFLMKASVMSFVCIILKVKPVYMSIIKTRLSQWYD